MTATVETLGAAAALLLAAALLVARTPEACTALYAWAAVPQAAVAAALAARGGAPELWLDAVAILLVKGLWVPGLLRRGQRGGGTVYSLQARGSSFTLFVGAGLVTLICLRLGQAVGEGAAGTALGLAVAGSFIGFSAAAVRTELWTQAAGILSAEGALTIGALVLVGGLGPIGELLVLLEVPALAAVLAVVARLAHATHGAADAGLLRRLRG